MYESEGSKALNHLFDCYISRGEVCARLIGSFDQRT